MIVLSNNDDITNIKHVPNARYHNWELIWILKFIPHYNSRREVPLSLFHR